MRSPVLVLAAVLASACARAPVTHFSEANARAHVQMLAGTIGSRPLGTPANDRARRYLVDQLTFFGFDVRVQDVDARRPEIGLTARVRNIVAIKPGARSEAIALVAHYDSSPAAPGATDDGLGVGVALEAARLLAARAARAYSLMVVLTDGEEAGLMGAAGLVADRSIVDRIAVYLNVESIGSAGPALLFETGPGNVWLAQAWARHAPHPRGGSVALEIYRRLPNDTDFSILKRRGLPGLNFVPVGDSYAYHTARDVPDRLSPRTVLEAGDNIVALVEALDRLDLTQRSLEPAVYFDVAGAGALAFGPRTAAILTVAALALAIVAWARAAIAAAAAVGAWRLAAATIWSVAGLAAAGAAMAGASWALRAAREVYHPWYAHPDRYFALLAACGVTAAWGVARLGAWLPARAHAARHPAVVWTIALPVWIALTAVTWWRTPDAAYLWTVPLAAAGAILAATPMHRSAAVRAASVLVLGFAGTLWARDTAELLRFMVTVFGREPMITPFWVYVPLMLAAGLMIAPPLVAAALTDRPLARPALVTTVLLLWIVVAAGLAYAAPAYTRERPLRRAVRSIVDVDATTAVWEVASTEPGLDLTPAAPAGWQRVTDAPLPRVPVRRFRHPFVFRTTTPVHSEAPAEVRGVIVESEAGATELQLTVVPREPGLAATFVLPPGLRPARANLPGVVSADRWRTTFLAPPAEGVALRAVFAGAAPAAAEALVLITAHRMPGGEGWQQLPAWLPQDRTVWTAEATWLVQPLKPLAPAPPLR